MLTIKYYRNALLIAYFIYLMLPIQCIVAQPLLPIQNDDIIFQTPLPNQSLAIQKTTYPSYNHRGIIPIKQSKYQHFISQQLENAHRALTIYALKPLHFYTKQFNNKSYDLLFTWPDDLTGSPKQVSNIYDHTLPNNRYNRVTPFTRTTFPIRDTFTSYQIEITIIQ